ncbi:Kelch repeat-containing protein [Pseudobacteroides sp.]|uniref:RCC1 domain-containing protein n=1 Tax=Pseudobacteroides sp. TaxID=1968840 RepID=UPI003BEF19B1
MLVRRYEPAVAAVKGKIYVIGGNASDYPNGAVDTIEEYDPVSNSWTIKGGLWKNGSGVWQSYGNGMPTKRFGMGVAVLDNKIYLIGGSNRDISLKSVEEYDPSAPPGSAWRIMQDLPIARYELSAAAVNGKIYAIGGWSGGVELASTTEFNPNYGLKGNWVDKSNMFYGRRELGVCEINGKIYAIGGYNGAGGGSVVANKVEEYDPIYNIWRTKASMSLNRRSLGVVALNGKAYAMGGGYTDVEEYQPDAANFGGEIAVSIDNLTTTPASEFSPVVFGESHSLSLNSDGEVSVSGYNSEGQLGLGDNQTRTIKQIIGGMKDVKQIAVGSGSTYILMNDGTVKVFGRNIFGQLGIINDKTNKNFPYTLQGVSGVKKLAVGYDHVIALLNNGNVLAWGKNNFGQLGLGSGISDSVPAQITQLSNVQDVYAGMDFSFAKLSNGKVMVWGRNDQNQLGLGATGNKYTPVENASLFNASQISGGLYHCIALMSDGKLKTWGGNAYGQLGFGDLNARSLPTEITSLTGTVNQISAGIYSSFALTKDGKVVAWGYNGNGVLGIGNNVSKTSPTFIPNLTGIKQISAGFYNCAAITNNDIIKVWGYNVGQLGLGNYEDSYSPVTINSNRTEYLRDEKDNIIKVTKPDGGYKLNFYDFKNSIIKQQDESGRLTFYVYDTNGNLLKKVQPLNGTDEYIEGTSDTSKFSITVHEYYASPGEKPIKGLLKYMYDPEFTSSKTTYNYDHNYYLNSVKDNNQYETTYTYDDRGWKTSQTSPKKFKTDYYYDPNGRLIKIVQNDGNGNGTNGTKQITKSSITRITYDKMGRITKEVHPNLYNSAYDNLATNEYTGLTP